MITIDPWKTKFGGHLNAKKVYVIDVDPKVRDRCQHLGNVEILIGDSSTLISPLIDKLNANGEGWDFALVDGDHSSEGVKKDLNALLQNRPTRPAWISMHDSFNPICRKGIKEANWTAPWVHYVEIDFVPGQLMGQPHVKNQMWGGISLSEIRPEDRPQSKIEIRENSELLFHAAYLRSTYYGRGFVERSVRKMLGDALRFISFS